MQHQQGDTLHLEICFPQLSYQWKQVIQAAKFIVIIFLLLSLTVLLINFCGHNRNLILFLCQIHQRSRPYIYCIDFGLSVFLFVLLSVASSKLLGCRKCRRMPRLHMMNNEKKWPGKFKVINQVQGQTEHQNVNQSL